MNIKAVLSLTTSTYVRAFLNTRYFASFLSKKGENNADSKPIYEIADETPIFEEEVQEKEIELESKRNKSRLEPHHRNILFGKKPYEESKAWYHDTVRYKKRILGRYGLQAINVPAGFAWPTPEEVDEAKEYEKVAYPRDIREEWIHIEEKHKQEAEYIRAREAEITAKLANMTKWTNELQNKLKKKEAELLAAKEKKERLMEEVRRHFGFKISVHDERFKEMLAKKELEEKKKQKEAKKKKRQEMIIMRAVEMENKNRKSSSEFNNDNNIITSEVKSKEQKEEEK